MTYQNHSRACFTVDNLEYRIVQNFDGENSN